VGLAVSGGLLLSANNLQTDASANKSQQEQHRLTDKASTRTLEGSVVGVGGAVALVAGVIKLAVHSEHTSLVTLNVGTSGTGLMVHGEF